MATCEAQLWASRAPRLSRPFAGSTLLWSPRRPHEGRVESCGPEDWGRCSVPGWGE